MTAREIKIFPFDKFIINSKLSLSELPPRLYEYVKDGEIPIYNVNRASKLYNGKVNDNGFAIDRILKYRNSFPTLVLGKFEKKETGSKIIIKMRPHKVAIINYLVFGALAICFGIKYKEIAPVFLIMLAYIGHTVIFNYELKRTKSDLRMMLKGELAN